MADYVLPSKDPTATRNGAAPPSNVVDRAAAILARGSPGLPILPASPALPALPPSRALPVLPAVLALPPLAGTMDGSRNPATSIDDLQRRAVALVSDFFSYLGAPPSGPGLLAQAASALPWRRPSVPAPAGGSASIPLRIENLEDRPVTISFYSSDLQGDGGRSIPSFAVSFHPAALDIAAGHQAIVTAKVDVPPQAIPGAYSGLIQAAGAPGMKAVITVDIC